MDHDENLSSDLTEFERQLKQARPRRNQLDRDHLMFLAGKTSAQAAKARTSDWQPWLRGCLTGGVAALLVGVLLTANPFQHERSAPLPAQQAERPQQQQEIASGQAIPAATGLKLHNDLLQFGLDGLPSSEEFSSESASPAPRSWRQLQHEIARPFDGSL